MLENVAITVLWSLYMSPKRAHDDLSTGYTEQPDLPAWGRRCDRSAHAFYDGGIQVYIPGTSFWLKIRLKDGTP